MKIFIDSADIDEIKDAYSSGVIDGVTTNPSLIKKAAEKQNAGKDLGDYIKRILDVAKSTPVSLEVTEYRYKDMVKQGKALFKKFNPSAKNVFIKIPVNPSFPDDETRDDEGIKAIKDLSKAGIPVNCTLIFTPEQALLAAKAGARFVSPFAGRVDDYIRKQNSIKFEKSDYYPACGMCRKKGMLHDNGIVSGVDLIAKTVEIFQEYGMKAEVLAASLRNVRQVRECALAGADIATLPFDVIKQLLVHHKSREGMEKFTKDVIPEYVKLTK
ncbi:transaldolase [Candidatus Woesearchaeota archaeon]|nr:transaldolase [Candidatus Woesearchaeota archaeon]